MAKNKILVITSSFPKSQEDNSGVFIEELSKRLTDLFDVFVLAPHSNNTLLQENRNGLNIFRFKYWFGKNLLSDGAMMANLKRNKLMYFQILSFLFSQFIEICKIVKREKINIIHAHWIIPQGFLAVIYKTFFNREIKILSTVLGSDINSFNNFTGKLLNKFILRRIDELTVVSNIIKEKVILLGYKKEVYVYPMGVDTGLFAPSKKDNNIKIKHDITGDLLLFVGCLNERKGIRYLIKAMPEISRKFPDIKLIVVGNGNIKDEMVELTEKLDITKHVSFVGLIAHTELPSYYATSDLFVLPSFSEGWPVAVMEALSSGTQTIVSNIPVFEQHEQKDHLFSIVPVGNSKAISDEVIRILSRNNNSANKEYLRSYAQNELDWKIISQKYKTLLLKL